MFKHAVLGLGVALCTLSLAAAVGAAVSKSSVFTFGNPTGQSETLVANGEVDLNNPFFQTLGTNGRRCVTCHMPDQGWSVSAERVQRRFALTAGQDAIFRTNDGSNSPQADVSTVEARRAAYSMLLTKGLIRVGLPIPSTAEFDRMIEHWFPLTYALNSLNRGLGQADAYPFVLSPTAIEKLRFVHETIRG